MNMMQARTACLYTACNSIYPSGIKYSEEILMITIV